MTPPALFSIVINNYNYARYLRIAIESALSQTLANIEVIVVDDGSTDGSVDILREYGDRIIPICKTNGGQASAFNAGFAASRGELVLFLDSDDLLSPGAFERLAAGFSSEAVIKVAAPLFVIDAAGAPTGRMVPKESLPSGNLLAMALLRGPRSHVTPPTSGNAWRRSYLESVLPIPEIEFRLCADAYLFTLTPLFGEVRALTLPVGGYRVHGDNGWANKRLLIDPESMGKFLDVFEARCRVLERAARPKYCVSAAAWRYRDFGHVKLALLRWRLFGIALCDAVPLKFIACSVRGAFEIGDLARIFKLLFLLISPLCLIRALAQHTSLKTRSAPGHPAHA